MKNDFHDRLTDAFGIPEPVRKEEFFSRLDEAQNKRRLLPIFLRVGSIAAAAAAAFTIWLSGRTTPDMVMDHHNDPGIITEFTTDTETTAAPEEQKPTGITEETSVSPTESGTECSISTKPVSVPATEASVTGTKPSSSQSIATQATAAAQPAGSSPSSPETRPSHSDGTTERKSAATTSPTTGKTSRVTTTVSAEPNTPKTAPATSSIKTKPDEEVRTTPTTTKEKNIPDNTRPKTETPTQRRTEPPQPAVVEPTESPTEYVNETPADVSTEVPTESPTWAAPVTDPIDMPTSPAPTEAPTQYVDTPTTHDGGHSGTSRDEGSIHNGDFYISPQNAIDTPTSYYSLSELESKDRTSDNFYGESKYDFLNDLYYDHAFIARVDEVFYIEDEYGTTMLVENVTILDNLCGSAMQGDRCSIATYCDIMKASELPDDYINEIYNNNPDADILRYYSGDYASGYVYNGPDDIYICNDTDISKDPQKNDICLFITYETSDGYLSYIHGTTEGRFTVKGRSIQNDYYTDYRFNVNEISEYFERRKYGG